MSDSAPDDPGPSAGDDPNQSGRRRFGLAEVIAGVLMAVGLGLLVWALVRDDGGDDAVENTAVPVTSDRGLNISCFAYRDVDRDGVYDLDDVPYAALTVTATGPATSATAASNTAGFANFVMSLGGEQALVDRAGSYRFEAQPPDGWILTSGPASQDVEFVEVAGSPAGVGPERECVPYGIAPTLTIRGTVGSADDDGTPAVGGPDGPVEVDVTDGVWVATVEPGTYEIEAADGSGGRSVAVADVAIVASGAADDRFDPRPNEVVVSFDEFTAANTLTEIPNDYGGLDWANWVSAHRILYGAPGYVNTNVSGEFVAYNSSGQPARISSAEPFDFVGAYIGVAWQAAELHDVVVRATRDGEVVHTDRLRLSTAGAVWFDADYRSIDELEISSDGNWQVVLDDAVFRTG